MVRRIHRLNGLDVKKAGVGMHADGGGLYLQVTGGNAKSWIFRYVLNGRERHMGLGSLGAIGLAEARKRAAEARKEISDGIDPLTTRDARRAAAAAANAKQITFDQCRDAYINTHRAGWRSVKHAAQWPSTLGTYVTPVFGNVPVRDIDTGLVLKVLEPIWNEKTETAYRVRGRIENILDWARVRGYREGENPARWRGHLDHLLPARSKVRKVEHHAALPYAELPAFMAQLRGMDGVAARALEFCILTGTRTNEVLGAIVDEIDGDVWTIPASRMKGGREHRVPLSRRALAIVEEMSRHRENVFPRDHVFPGVRGARLNKLALLLQLDRMGSSDLTVHGFRSTFRDWAAEQTAFPNEVVEMALAHTVSDKVEAAYRRGDLFEKRRRLMDAWAEYCQQGRATGDVTPLRAVR